MTIPAGYTALDMIGFTDKGVYDATIEYVKNDLTHYGGNIWRCLVDETTGVTPTEGVCWTLFIGEPTNLIERIIAPIETSPTQQAWVAGRQFIYNDLLYEVIDTIAIGDSLVAYESDPSNANIKLALPVETQLLNLKALDENVTRTIAPLETSPTTAAHNVGDQFFWNGVLYTAIDTIAIGSALIVDTNVEASESIVEQLANKGGGGGGGAYYGMSTTAGNVAAKVVTTQDGNFTLETGADIIIKFANNDTAGAITLAIDGKAAKPVYKDGVAITANVIKSVGVYEFVYNGAQFELVGNPTAAGQVYDNTNSGLTATDTQGAIDEVAARLNITYNATTEMITFPSSVASYDSQTEMITLN